MTSSPPIPLEIRLWTQLDFTLDPKDGCSVFSGRLVPDATSHSRISEFIHLPLVLPAKCKPNAKEKRNRYRFSRVKIYMGAAYWDCKFAHLRSMGTS
jgi:hypothetical protein